MSPGEGEAERLAFPRPADPDHDLGAGLAAEPMLDHFLEIASHGEFAVDVGDDVADFEPRQMGRAASDDLAHHYLTIGPRGAVDADSAKIARGIDRSCLG